MEPSDLATDYENFRRVKTTRTQVTENALGEVHSLIRKMNSRNSVFLSMGKVSRKGDEQPGRWTSGERSVSAISDMIGLSGVKDWEGEWKRPSAPPSKHLLKIKTDGMCHVRRILWKKLLNCTRSELMEKSPRFGDLDSNPISTANLLWNNGKLFSLILSQVFHWQWSSNINTIVVRQNHIFFTLDRYTTSTNS